MAVAGSLLPPMAIPIFGKHVHCGQFKALMDKTPLYSFRFPLSSHSVDALSFYVLNNLHGPLSPRCAKFNRLLCRSFLKPSGGNEIPILKAAATIISRAYSNLPGSPLVLQLVPAVGILVFASCGLIPLTRFGRTTFLNKSDSNWNKTGTYYITASYVQPLLLWTGAMLVCRALDPLILSSTASQAVKQRLLNFIRSLSTVLAVTYCLSSLIKQSQNFFVESKDSTDSRNMGFDFAGKAVYTAVWIAAASLFMELLGFSTQKWLTAGGLGTVLLTLAGREILTNFLSSVMIHATQPFIPNDWIQTTIGGYDVSGTVEHVGWWSPTVIRADDREAVHIPSHKFTVNVVRNLSQRTHWRVKTHIAISHFDVNKINSIVADMRKVLAKNPQVEQQKLHRRVFLDNVDSESQALLIMVSCFIKTSRFEEYLCVKESLLLDLLRVISHHRARLATPIRTMHKVYGETDETVPFTETIFTSTRAASNRRLLLIGSSYKINDEDKTRTVDPSVQPDEGKAEKVTLDTKVAASILDDDKVDGKGGCLASNNNGDSKTTIGTNSTPDTLQNMDLFDSEESNSMEPRTDSSAVAKEDEAVTNLKVDDVLSEGKGITETQCPSIQELRSNEIATASTTLQAMPDVGRRISSPSKTSLEDNIVLGVALEGSKMMLPIEE